MKKNINRGFTLIELLVVISIIALLSSVVAASLSSARKKARDSARIQIARQIAIALEQYEQSNNTYRISNSGLSANHGSGFVTKGIESPGYTNSILTTLKQAGFISSDSLKDPVYGMDNFYLGQCTSTNAYNVFVKLEQAEYNQATSSIINTCGGPDAASLGFSYIASTAGGSSGGGGTGGYVGSSEIGGGGGSVGAVGSIDLTFTPGTGPFGTVTVSSLQTDGKIIIGGNFTSYNGTGRNRIARINADGSLDTSFNPGTGADNYVNVVTIQSDGKILIGGTFANYNGTARARIARINSDGSLDTSFNPGAGADSSVSAIAVQSDGKIVIAGNFTAYNGTARNYISRINSDGSIDTTFNPGTGANMAVYNLYIQPDGKILIAGSFNFYNGNSRGRIARVNSNGSIDTSFDPGTGANNTVTSITVQSDLKIIVAGNFTAYDGTGRSYLARVNSNGSLDSSFNPGTGASDISSLAIQSDGKILAGGGFTSYNGTGRNRIVRINIDGYIDTTFNPGTGANSTIQTVSIQPDGKIIIGGYFNMYNGTSRNYFSRIQ